MNYKVVISQELSSGWDKWYIIVDENNKLLDDAQGYFKSFKILILN